MALKRERNRSLTTTGVKIEPANPLQTLHARGNSLTAPVKVTAAASGQTAPMKVCVVWCGVVNEGVCGVVWCGVVAVLCGVVLCGARR